MATNFSFSQLHGIVPNSHSLPTQLFLNSTHSFKMLSKTLVSALLVLQASFGFVAANEIADEITGRKIFAVPRSLLARQTTSCPVGSFMCDDNTGCCDTGTTCGFRASDNYPVCKGGTCSGGPICLSGLCCDFGYVCDEAAKLCTKENPLNSSPSSSPIRSSSSTRSSAPTRTSSAVRTTTSDDSSSTDNSSETTSTRRTTAPTSATDPFVFGVPTSVDVGSPTGTRFPLPSNAAAEPLSGNSVLKVAVGAIAGALAFVL